MFVFSLKTTEISNYDDYYRKLVPMSEVLRSSDIIGQTPGMLGTWGSAFCYKSQQVHAKNYFNQTRKSYITCLFKRCF